jgi:hypothetical protein
VLQDEGDEVGQIVNDNADFDNVHQFAEHIARDPGNDGSSYDKGCQMANDNVLAYDSKLKFENIIGSRWIDNDDSYSD